MQPGNQSIQNEAGTGICLTATYATNFSGLCPAVDRTRPVLCSITLRSRFPVLPMYVNSPPKLRSTYTNQHGISQLPRSCYNGGRTNMVRFRTDLPDQLELQPACQTKLPLLGSVVWRRGWDSNPRDALGVNTLSRRASSTTPAPLRSESTRLAWLESPGRNPRLKRFREFQVALVRKSIIPT